VARAAIYRPLADLRRGLEEARRAGADFETAWHRAMGGEVYPGDTWTRENWKLAISETREEWRRCYEGEPSPVAAAISLIVAFAEDRARAAPTVVPREPRLHA
jgi:hypothetical protein